MGKVLGHRDEAQDHSPDDDVETRHLCHGELLEGETEGILSHEVSEVYPM
jgi:hypothetical protein